MTYNIIIREILEKEISIEANDKDSAMDLVTDFYKKGYIVLDSDNYLETTIEVKEDN